MPRLQRLIFAPEQFHHQSVTLNADQGRYLLKVLRLSQGDRFIAMDGIGHWWIAEIVSSEQANLIQPIKINNELPLPLTLIAAPPKGNGFDSVIHSATEIGVQAIYPLISERTIVHPHAPKIQRWQKIAREATEQSLRQIVPNVFNPLTFQELKEPTQPWNQTGLTVFCSTQAHHPHLQSLLSNQLNPLQIKQITILSGPEGGWSPQEEAQLIQLGFIGISLGKRVLRAVTAPINAMSLAAAFCEVGLNSLPLSL